MGRASAEPLQLSTMACDSAGNSESFTLTSEAGGRRASIYVVDGGSAMGIVPVRCEKRDVFRKSVRPFISSKGA